MVEKSAYYDAFESGVIADGLANDRASFQNFLQTVSSSGQIGYWVGGAIIDVSGGPIKLSSAAGKKTYSLSIQGLTLSQSYLYLNGLTTEPFLQLEDRLGLWIGDLDSQLLPPKPTSQPRRSPPPPARFSTLELRNFAVFG